jgi:hypothetical protein
MFDCEKSAAHALVLALTVGLGGCAATEFVQNWTTPPAADLSEPNYRRIVNENLKKIFPNQPAADLEISGVRPVDHLKGPAWLTCIRLDPGGNPQLYAIFIQNDSVIDWRGAVVIDQCHKQSYTTLEPLPAPAPPKQPAPTVGVASPRTGKRL